MVLAVSSRFPAIFRSFYFSLPRIIFCLLAKAYSKTPGRAYVPIRTIKKIKSNKCKNCHPNGYHSTHKTCFVRVEIYCKNSPIFVINQSIHSYAYPMEACICAHSPIAHMAHSIRSSCFVWYVVFVVSTSAHS